MQERGAAFWRLLQAQPQARLYVMGASRQDLFPLIHKQAKLRLMGRFWQRLVLLIL